MNKSNNDVRIISKLSSSALYPDSVVPIRTNPELNKMQPMTYDEILSSNPPVLKYILSPWLPVQGIAFIYAATGVGKTLFTMNVAYAIASGGEFLKFKVPTPRKILYVDGEMSYSQMHSRFMDIRRQQGELEEKENWNLLTPEKAIFKLPDIDTLEGQEYYDNKIKELGIEVLILDNLSTLSSFDHNSAVEWKPIQDWLINLRMKGITTIVVHHSGKDPHGFRGTSRMLDVVDTAISLQDQSDSKLENEIISAKKIKIVYQKNRCFSGKDSLSFEASLNNLGWEFESLEQTNIHRIAEMLNNKMRQVNIARELNVKESYVSKVVRICRSRGMLKE